MVADLGVIENALVRQHPVARQNLVGKGRVAGKQDLVVTLAGPFAGQHRQRFLDRGDVIFGQAAGVGTRVGEHLVLFVQGLRQRQCRLCRKTEASVRFALKACQIEEQGRQAGFRLGLFGHTTELAERRGTQGIGLLLFPDAVGAGVFVAGLVVTFLAFETFVEPFAGVGAGAGLEFGFDLPVRTRLEFADLALTLDDDGQRWCLDTTDGGQVEAAGL